MQDLYMIETRILENIHFRSILRAPKEPMNSLLKFRSFLIILAAKKEINIFQTRSLDVRSHTKQKTTSNVCGYTHLNYSDRKVLSGRFSEYFLSYRSFFIRAFPSSHTWRSDLLTVVPFQFQGYVLIPGRLYLD